MRRRVSAIACKTEVLRKLRPFKPKPQDPQGVQPAMLSDALNAVFTGSPALAEFLVPFLVDRLVSSPDYKVDALQSLTAICKAASATAAAPFVKDLWNIIRNEVFGASDTDIVAACLGLLKEYVAVLVGPGSADGAPADVRDAWAALSSSITVCYLLRPCV